MIDIPGNIESQIRSPKVAAGRFPCTSFDPAPAEGIFESTCINPTKEPKKCEMCREYNQLRRHLGNIANGAIQTGIFLNGGSPQISFEKGRG